jgi:type VI secretion system protein
MKSYHRLLPEQTAQMSLEEGGLTIGRDPSCDWVILDPERVVSKAHCRIELSGNAYVLTDTSSNGVFLGDRQDPLGNGNAVILKDGDLIRISDYEIQVNLRGATQVPVGEAQAEPSGLVPGEIQPLPSLAGAPAPGAPEPIPEPPVPPPDTRSPLLAPQEPLAAAPIAETSGLIPDDWDDLDSGSVGSHSDHIAPQDEVFQVPDPVAEIPADWTAEEEAALELPADELEPAHEAVPQVTPAADLPEPPGLLDVPAPPPIETEGAVSPVETEGLALPPIESEVAAPPVETEGLAPPPIETEGAAPPVETEGLAPPPLEAEIPPPPLEAEFPVPPLETEVSVPPLLETEVPPPLPLETEVPAPPPLETEIPVLPPIVPEAPEPLLAKDAPVIGETVGGERAGGGDALDAFLAGAGVAPIPLTEQERRELMGVLGAVFREVVQGLVEVLAARTSIKSEFRLSQTTIRPTENNPLKFSLSVDDALLALITKRGQGYLEPVDAVREAFDDIKAHQVAFIAGMQMALTDMLQRFDPKVLEERLEGQSGVGGLLGSKKAKHWDAFTLLYETMTSEAEDDFQDLFGREFARAYEEQVQKLRAAKTDPQGG